MYKDYNTLNLKPYEDDKKFGQSSDRPTASPSSMMSTGNQFALPENYIKDNLDLEYKSSFLGAKLSELEETYKNQMNRQVLNSITNLYRQIVEEMKTDMNERFARQGEDHTAIVEKLRRDLKEEFNGKLNKQREEYTQFRDNLEVELKSEFTAKLMKQREEYIQLKENLHAQVRAEINHKIAKMSEELLITKENIMSQLRSETNARFAKQGEEILTTKEKLQEQFREELDDKISIQNEEIIILKEDFQIQLQTLNSNVTKMQEKIEMNLTKEMHGLKAKVFEMIDSSSEKFKSIWVNLDSLSKHLGIRIDSSNGDLTILRESVERLRGFSPDNKNLTRTSSTFKQSQAEFLRDNLSRIADKLRIYREAIYAVTKNQSLTQSHWRIHQRELLQGASLEDACDHVVTMEDLAMIVKAMILENKRETAKLKDVVDENAIAQNDFNASIAGKIKDLEEVTHFAQENFNSLSEDFNLFVAQESHNTEIGINKRENLRRDIDKIMFRLEELSDNYKHLTDPIAVSRLQKLLWSADKPEHVNRGSDHIIPEDIDERMGAMEFIMWRYARNFVEPEAMKRIAKITKVTVPVYEKLENLLFLIKNCGFIEPRTIRHAIRTFKDAIARLGRRCVKEKQDAFEEVWKLVQAATELDTVYYYYLLEVFCSLLSEEKNNLDRAFELSVFEFLFELLRKKESSQPAQACLLKALWLLCKTEVHLEFIQKAHLVPDLLALCRPILEAYGKSIYPDQSLSPLSHRIEERLHGGANFDSNDILEIDGMFVKTALVYYSLRLFSEVFKKAPLVQHSDLTFMIQSILRLLKRAILLHNIRELSIIILHRIFVGSQGKYMGILCIPECVDLLEINSEDPNLSKEARVAAQELILGLREGLPPGEKKTSNFRTTSNSISNQTRSKSVKYSKPGTTGTDYRMSPTRLPHISQRNTTTYEKSIRPRIYERADRLSEFLELRPELTGTLGQEGSIYSKTRKERLSKAKFVDSDYTAVISKTGLMTCIPKNQGKKSPTKALRGAHSSSLYPVYTQPDESFEEAIRRSREASLEPMMNRERMFHSFIEGESRQDSEDEPSYMQPKSVENTGKKSGSAGTKEKLGEIVKDHGEKEKKDYIFKVEPVPKDSQKDERNEKEENERR